MKLPRYSEYKNSGMSWIGEVPSHWSVRRLKEIVRFSGGGTPSRENPAFWNGDIPWISPKDMKSEFISSSEESITTAGLAGSASSLVPQGTLLMVVRSGILKHTIPVGINTIPVALNQDMKALHAYGVRTDFLLRWVQGLNDRLLLAWAKQGATVESIEYDYLANTLIPHPDDGEQRAITAFLDRETAKIDALIAEQERLLELLAEKRQAVISHAVTKGLNPDAPMKDSGVAWLGDVPAHWDVARLATLYREVNEPGSDDRPTLSVSIHDGVSDDEIDEADSERKITRSEDKGKYKRVEPNDLTYNMMRAWQGAFGSVTVSGQVSPAYVVARPRTIIETGFVEALLRTPKAKEQIRRYSRGITDFRLRLYWDEFKELRVGVPPHNEQVEVLASIDQMNRQFDELQSAAESLINLLYERRSALIAAAVTGQIDVREAA